MYTCKICGEPCSWLICQECRDSKNHNIIQRRQVLEKDPNAKPKKLAKVVDWVLAKFEDNDD